MCDSRNSFFFTSTVFLAVFFRLRGTNFLYRHFQVAQNLFTETSLSGIKGSVVVQNVGMLH